MKDLKMCEVLHQIHNLCKYANVATSEISLAQLQLKLLRSHTVFGCVSGLKLCKTPEITLQIDVRT